LGEKRHCDEPWGGCAQCEEAISFLSETINDKIASSFLLPMTTCCLMEAVFVMAQCIAPLLHIQVYELQKSKIVNRYSIFGLSCHITMWTPFPRVFLLAMMEITNGSVARNIIRSSLKSLPIARHLSTSANFSQVKTRSFQELFVARPDFCFFFAKIVL